MKIYVRVCSENVKVPKLFDVTNDSRQTTVGGELCDTVFACSAPVFI